MIRQTFPTEFAASVLTVCAADWRDGDEHFFVTYRDAAMPIRVTGNQHSSRIIVHVQGGPGTTCGI